MKRCFFFIDGVNTVFSVKELEKIALLFHEVILVVKHKVETPLPNNIVVFQVSEPSKLLKVKLLIKYFITIQTILLKDVFSQNSSFSYFKQYFLRQSYLLNGFCSKEQLLKKYEINNSDILYAFMAINSSVLPAIVSEKVNAKFIVLTHGRDLYENLEPITGKLAFRKFIFSKAHKVLSVSNKGKEYLLEKYPIYAQKIETYYLGTKKNSQLLNKKTNDNELTIVSCANIKTSNIKRLELIPPMLVALTEITDKTINWIHFGNYDFNLNKLLKKELDKTSFKENSQINVTFKGATVNDDILSFYSTQPVSFFLSTSSSEGLPFSMMEVSSYGIPIICTDVGGCNEITHSGLLLTPNFTVNEFMEKYKILMSIESEYREKTFLLWEKNFSFEKSSSDFIKTIT